ncbi:MAG: hypothetical protein Q3976_05525 [Corynebacterium sp.]|nr:hypothetical protein [Corynebacterium sp.]
MTADLLSIGMKFDTWQDAVEAAIASNGLSVTGEIRGGQLIQYADTSGAQINILAVEPFATYAGFDSVTMCFAHISMITDVVALAQIIDYHEQEVALVTLNLAQGPLLADQPEQRWQQLSLTALASSAKVYDGDDESFYRSPGADLVAQGSGAQVPDAAFEFRARVLSSGYRTNALTNERFIHVTVDGAFPFDVCLPDSDTLPERNSMIEGFGVLTGSIAAPQGCGGGCGSGGCGCGGH